MDEAEPLMRESYNEIVAKLGVDNEHSVKARARLERLQEAKIKGLSPIGENVLLAFSQI